MKNSLNTSSETNSLGFDWKLEYIAFFFLACTYIVSDGTTLYKIINTFDTFIYFLWIPFVIFFWGSVVSLFGGNIKNTKTDGEVVIIPLKKYRWRFILLTILYGLSLTLVYDLTYTYLVNNVILSDELLISLGLSCLTLVLFFIPTKFIPKSKDL